MRIQTPESSAPRVKAAAEMHDDQGRVRSDHLARRMNDAFHGNPTRPAAPRRTTRTTSAESGHRRQRQLQPAVPKTPHEKSSSHSVSPLDPERTSVSTRRNNLSPVEEDGRRDRRQRSGSGDGLSGLVIDARDSSGSSSSFNSVRIDDDLPASYGSCSSSSSSAREQRCSVAINQPAGSGNSWWPIPHHCRNEGKSQNGLNGGKDELVLFAERSGNTRTSPSRSTEREVRRETREAEGRKFRVGGRGRSEQYEVESSGKRWRSSQPSSSFSLCRCFRQRRERSRSNSRELLSPAVTSNRGCCLQFDRTRIMGGLSLLVCACALFGLGSATFFIRPSSNEKGSAETKAGEVGSQLAPAVVPRIREDDEIRIPKALLASGERQFAPTTPSGLSSYHDFHHHHHQRQHQHQRPPSGNFRRPYSADGFSPFDPGYHPHHQQHPAQHQQQGHHHNHRLHQHHQPTPLATPSAGADSDVGFYSPIPQLATSGQNAGSAFSHRIHAKPVSDVPAPFQAGGGDLFISSTVSVNPQSVSGVTDPSLERQENSVLSRLEELQASGNGDGNQQRHGIADFSADDNTGSSTRERPASSSQVHHGNNSPSDTAEMYRQILKYVSEGNFFPDNRFNMYADAALNNLVVSILEHDNDPLVFNIFSENRVEPSTVVTILGRKKRNANEEDSEGSTNREGRQANNNNRNNRNQLIGSGVITGLSNVTRVNDAEIRVPDPTRTLIKTEARIGPSQMTLNLNALQRRRNGIMQILIPPNRDNAEERQREIQIDIPAFPVTITSAVTASGSALDDFEMMPIDMAKLNMSFPADLSSNNNRNRQETLHEQCFFIVQNAFSTAGFMQERLRRYAGLAVDSRIHR